MSLFPFSNVSAFCLHVFLRANLANLLSSVYMGVSHWLPGPVRTATTALSLVEGPVCSGWPLLLRPTWDPLACSSCHPLFPLRYLTADSAAQSSCSPTTTSSPVPPHKLRKPKTSFLTVYFLQLPSAPWPHLGFLESSHSGVRGPDISQRLCLSLCVGFSMAVSVLVHKLDGH